MAETMIELVKAFRDLPGRNVVMTAKVERQTDELSGAVLLTPSCPGAQLATKLPYLFDELLYLRLDKDGNLRLMDEVLTADSSRFWPADEYSVGRSPPSFDKQFVRDWLERQPWDKAPPPPALPADVIEKTADKYREALRRITGKELD
jgi:hypothetical protein